MSVRKKWLPDMAGSTDSGAMSAWHYATRQAVHVRWRQGVITHLETAMKPPPRGLWIAPTLFDLQINGFAGVDFQQDDLTADDLLRAARALRAAGCTRFLLTLITDDWQPLTARLRHLRGLRAKSAELRSAIAGWHIEGPFLSAEPGFHGTHDPVRMTDMTLEHVLEFRSITGQDPLLLTIAPERRGAIEAIALASSRGAKVSLGHTDAPTRILEAAVQAGATGFTHLGNGCPRELDRHDNILWRALDTPGLTVSLIPDRIHVSPAFFRLVHRVLNPSAIYYTTDAMAAAGAPPGRYKLGRLEIEVGAGQIVRQPGRTNFAGSAAQPIDVVFRAAEMLGCTWQEVWPHLSLTPARFMELHHDLAIGRPASFCLLKVVARNQLLELQVYADGRTQHPAKATTR